MNTLVLYSIYAGTFIAALLVCEALLISFRGSHHSHAVNKRMKMINHTGNRHAALTLLRDERKGGLVGALRQALPSFHRSLWLAGISTSSVKILSAMGAATILLFVLIEVISVFPIPVSFLLAFFIGILLPWLVIRFRAGRRRKRFGEQLPPAIDLIVRSLEAGHPVAIALGMVAREMPDPIGTEFGIAVDEMTYGLRMDEALQNMVKRFPSGDLQFLIMAVQIQRTTGGNLGEILNNLSSIIRARHTMYKKIKAISAEGRASGIVVGLLPFVVGGLILVVNSSYFSDVAEDILFYPLLGVAFISLMMGWVTMWFMVKIKV